MKPAHRQPIDLWHRLIQLVLHYTAAVIIVGVGLGMRLAITGWVGPGLPTYVTFYPWIMVVAMLGGLGPGLVAIALTAMVVDYWVLPLFGQFTIASPVERLGLILFIIFSVFISVVAEYYRRYQRKATAYDRDVSIRENYKALRQNEEQLQARTAELNVANAALIDARKIGRAHV